MKPTITVLLLLLTWQINAQIYIEKGVSTTVHFQTHLLVTTNGDEFIGRTTSLDSGMVGFKIRQANEILLDYAQVDSIKLMGSEDFHRVYRFDFAERTALMPTAFGLNKGALEYHNEFVFINTINYGVRDHFTVGAGIAPVPNNYFYNVHLKLSENLGQYIHVALGGLFGAGRSNDGYTNDIYTDGSASQIRYLMPFGSLTLGSRQNFISFSLGKAFYDEDGEGDSPIYLYTLNAGMRLTNRLRAYIETGNSVEKYSERINNAGIGIIGKKSILNMGLFFGEDLDGVLVPCLSYSRRIKS